MVDEAMGCASRVIVNPGRLAEPEDNFTQAFPGLGFRDVYSVCTSGESLLLVDPIYLADVYNSGDELASYLRSRGIFVKEFGGDVSCPV